MQETHSFCTNTTKLRNPGGWTKRFPDFSGLFRILPDSSGLLFCQAKPLVMSEIKTSKTQSPELEINKTHRDSQTNEIKISKTHRPELEINKTNILCLTILHLVVRTARDPKVYCFWHVWPLLIWLKLCEIARFDAHHCKSQKSK